MNRCLFLEIVLFAMFVYGEPEKENSHLSITKIARACARDETCSAKRIIDKTTREPEIAAEIEATFMSHGITRETQNLLAEECSADALVAMTTDLYPSCVDPVDVIDRRSASYNVVAVSVFLIVLNGIYIALFVVWTFRYRPKGEKAS